MGPCDFPRSVRLLTPRDFRRVFEQASFRASHRLFLLLAIPSSAATARIGMVVAKKNIRHAVGRNRVKRLVRESFRHRCGQMPALDIVVLVRKDAGVSENAEIKAVLDKLWSRLARLASEQVHEGEAS